MKVNICRVKWLLMVILFITGGCDGQLSRTFYHLIRDWASIFIGRTTDDPRLLQEAMRLNKFQDKIPESTDFPCRFIGPIEAKAKKRNGRFEQVSNDADISQLPRARSEVRPTSVHSLRPGDFDIIAAMGDSLTSGNGAAASNVLHLVSENRGITWSIGGQGTWREYVTLPNILKVFNPKLIGFSLSDAYGHHRATQFNVAERGAMSKDLPYMAKALVTRLNKDPRVNIKEDWKVLNKCGEYKEELFEFESSEKFKVIIKCKLGECNEDYSGFYTLVTVMIGANDICYDVCYQNSLQEIPSMHRRKMIEALLILKKNLPRTFVNFIPLLDVDLLRRLKGKPFLCYLTATSLCPCLFGEPNKHKYKEMMNIIKRWQQIDIDIENAPELNDQDDFAVVVQPFVLESVPVDGPDGQTDLSLFSVDCFHFSQKAGAWAANALWNNMLQPTGRKQRITEKVFNNFVCPTVQFPYIYTLKNSKGFTNTTSR